MIIDDCRLLIDVLPNNLMMFVSSVLIEFKLGKLKPTEFHK